MNTRYTEKAIEQAKQDKEEIAALYHVDASSIVWIGNRNYIVVFADGTELKI